jgi:hypothetical protein
MTRSAFFSEFGTAIGGKYNLAPGLQLVLEYQHEYRHYGGYDFSQGTWASVSEPLTAKAGTGADPSGSKRIERVSRSPAAIGTCGSQAAKSIKL